jgi:DNA-binding SARP family transcriptional activator
LELRVDIALMQALEERSITPSLATRFAQLEPKLLHAPPILLAHFQFVQAMRLLARGELVAARDLANRAGPFVRSASWVVGHAMMLIVQAQIECESGAFELATELLQESFDTVRGLGIPLLEFNGGLTGAEIARREGREKDFTERLAQALALGREHGFANMFHADARLLPRLIPHALQRGIEIEYCRWVIRARQLPPPAPMLTHWPWPIRIRALGAFEVLIGEEPLMFEGKSKQKPLSILKELLPSPTGVDIGALMHRLWPDLDGDAARNAFDLALHRLRKLLTPAGSVILAHGRLRLGTNVWVDAHALDCMADASEPEVSPEEQARRLLHLYRGPFLMDEDQASLIAARERLRSQFVRLILEIGSALPGARLDTRTDLYQRALEREPLAEAISCALMREFARQGRQSEAVQEYHRSRTALAQALGSQPSTAARRLFEQLRHPRGLNPGNLGG